MARLLSLLLCGLALFAVSCGDDDDGGDSAQNGGDSGGQQAQEPADSGSGEGGCEEVAQPEPKPDGGQKKPKGKLPAGKRFDVTLATNCGDITIRVDQKTAPNTAASFVSLARSGFYDNTIFHRIVPGFVIQGGDPTGTGTGGPGYSVRDAPPQDAAYTEGVVAMAKTEVEPPGTSGSQFYIVTGADAGLPPDYALLGKVVEGMDVALAIDKLGDPASGGAGTPLQTILIETATVSGS